jgi:hypothetical protein
MPDLCTKPHHRRGQDRNCLAPDHTRSSSPSIRQLRPCRSHHGFHQHQHTLPKAGIETDLILWDVERGDHIGYYWEHPTNQLTRSGARPTLRKTLRQ